jgi:alginate O-acetyltransferase complex protein AlgI
MAFSSITFLIVFLPIFLLGYTLLPKAFKNPFILFSSIFFYAWGAPLFIFVILGTTFLDFFFVKFLAEGKEQRTRKLFLIVSLVMNLGLLAYFKYANFFIENVNALLDSAGVQNVAWVKVVLPIGISFYTFESITYVVDVYRKVHKPLKNFWDYQLYIILFPKLIAGPIIRYNLLADQITNREDTIDDKLVGFVRFSIGLAKKMLIANVLGEQADEIMKIPMLELSSFVAWIGIIAYSFQIYFDFSGYSDMAIGLARMMGFRFPENFDNPYTSRSITEFWRRWHISLGQWMKNYLYIPLGGNRVKSPYRLYLNLWLVFLLSGLWHGASWNFIIWGAIHGLFLILDRLFLGKVLDSIGKIPSMLFTFVVVAVAWVFFRIEKFGDAVAYVKKLFSFQGDIHFEWNTQFVFISCLAIFFSFMYAFKVFKPLQYFFFDGSSYSTKKSLGIVCISMLLFTLSLSALTSDGFNPFIYFRF